MTLCASTRTETDLRETVAEGAALVAALQERLGTDTHEARVEVSRAAIRWAAETFGDRLTTSSSMGDTTLVYLVAGEVEGADVFFLDTGYHFSETIGTRDALSVELPIQIRTSYPLQTVGEQDEEYGSNLFARNPDQCCAMRKVEPLERALESHEAWVSGLRREDAPTRKDIHVVMWDARRKMAKINPLALWTREDVERYNEERGVFTNPLLSEGYPSIGCKPCTSSVAPGEDPRSGRWAGRSKTECGLHA